MLLIPESLLLVLVAKLNSFFRIWEKVAIEWINNGRIKINCLISYSFDKCTSIVLHDLNSGEISWVNRFFILKLVSLSQKPKLLDQCLF